MAGPLAGITVLDLSTVIAGPYATQILGDMGAEVIKIEPPQGDIMRGAGPARNPGMGAPFLNCNRNKQSRTLDLKNAADHAELMQLAAQADVFIHNMRSSACARLGLNHEVLLAHNPRLVYCAIVGHGQDGPYRDLPAYDDIIQATAGWAGIDQDAGGAPRYAPTIVADKTTALYTVAAINAALLARERGGSGQYVEVPMLEVMASFLLVEQMGGMTFSPPLGPAGYARLKSPNRRPYRTSDGYISVMPYDGNHWASFFQAAGRPELAADTRLASAVQRAAMIDELYLALSDALPARSTDEWMVILQAADIPCSRVNTIASLRDDPHLQQTGFFVEVDHPTEGRLLTTRPPVRFSATPCSLRYPSPPLASHGGPEANGSETTAAVDPGGGGEPV